MLQRFKNFSIALSLAFICAYSSVKAVANPVPASKVSTVQNNERALPAHSTIYISSKYALQLIEVYDEQGNLYEKIPLQAATWYALDIKKWPLGIYTVKVENNVSSVKRKILKVR